MVVGWLVFDHRYYNRYGLIHHNHCHNSLFEQTQYHQCNIGHLQYLNLQTARQLLSIAVPISLGAAGMQLIIAIDGAVYMARLKGAAGFATETANDMKGIYNFCQTIFNMPCAFITPLTISVIPAITEQLTRRASRVANTVAESAIRVTSLIAMPCSVGLIVLAEPIMGFLGHYAGADLVLAAKLMRILGVCVGINSLVLIVTAILQAHGYVYLPVLNLAIGGIVKIIVNFVLVGNPKINIVGAPLGTLACYLLISGLDVFAMKRVLRRPPAVLRNVWKSAVAAVLMGAVAWLVNRVLAGAGLSAAIRATGSILVAVFVYAVLVLLLKIITKDDCRLLPKGDKIAKILKIS